MKEVLREAGIPCAQSTGFGSAVVLLPAVPAGTFRQSLDRVETPRESRHLRGALRVTEARFDEHPGRLRLDSEFDLRLVL